MPKTFCVPMYPYRSPFVDQLVEKVIGPTNFLLNPNCVMLTDSRNNEEKKKASVRVSFPLKMTQKRDDNDVDTQLPSIAGG